MVFEFLLIGRDPAALERAAGEALAEVERIGRLLSPRDPQSELARLNRAAGARTVRVGRELLCLLVEAGKLGLSTGGHYDPTAPGRLGIGDGRLAGLGAILIDPTRRLVRYSRPDVRIDLGGFGRGYALDRAAAILRAHGVERGLLHAGPDTALALDTGWEVGLRAPGLPPGSPCVARVPLARRALARSASVDERGNPRVLRPRDGSVVPGRDGCAVIAPSAAAAEALSIALLSMGRRQAGFFCASAQSCGLQAAWLQDELTWLRREG